MKLHHYDQMMAYLTRRQKFSNGGDAILPKPNPLSPTERNQKVFYDYVGRMKHYLTGADMPEWFVKDLITKKAEELGIELKAGGGSIQPRRKYFGGAVGMAAPTLTYPVMLGLAETLGIATAGVGATALSSAVSDKIKENPEILNTPQAQAIMLSFGLVPPKAEDLTHKSVTETGLGLDIGDKGEKEKERERIAAEEKKKYDDIKWGVKEEIKMPLHTGHPAPVQEKWEVPVNIPPKIADAQLPGFPDLSEELNKPQILTSETAQAKEKTAQALEDLLKERAAKLPGTEGRKKTDWTTDEEFIKRFDQYKDTYFGGNLSSASKSIGESREKIKAIYDRTLARGWQGRAAGSISSGGKMRVNVAEPIDGIAYTDATTLAKKDSNFLKKFITEENAGEFMSAKEIAHTLGVKFSSEGRIGQKQLDQLVYDLRRFNVESQHYSGTQSLYNFEDAVNKITEGYKKKLVKGEALSQTKRLEVEKRLDPELFNVRSKMNARIRAVSKNEDIYLSGAIDDLDHPVSIKITDEFPKLFENSTVNKIGSLVYNDPYINRDVKKLTGYETKFHSMFEELDKLVNKPVTAETQAQILKIKEKMNTNYDELIETLSNPKKLKKIMADAGKEITSSHLKKISKQTDRIVKIDIKVPKIGEKFLSENLFADMSNVDPVWIMGNVDKINPDAKYFKDLSSEQKDLYEANMLEQSANILEDYYKKSKFPKEHIDELREALTEKYSTGGAVYGKYADQIKNLKIS